MLGEYVHYGLLVALAIALLVAAFTDMRRRQIDNWLTAAIALAAPIFWWSSGMALWPDIAIQFAQALVIFAVLAGLFALHMMGGGDVKLLTALALWITPMLFMQFLIIMALLGGVLAVMLGSWHVIKRQRDRMSIPYGIAISTAGIWILYTNYFPTANQAIGLG